MDVVWGRLHDYEIKDWRLQSISVCFLIVIHIPIFVSMPIIEGWGKSKDTSFHHYLENTEGHGYFYTFPIWAYVPHVGCQIMRYMNMWCTRPEY